MTVPKNLVNDVINLLSEWLSDEARGQLLNCGGPRCEVVGQTTDLMGDSEPTRQDRKFRVARAVRYDIDGEDTTLIAFSSAVSDFMLNKQVLDSFKHHASPSKFGAHSCNYRYYYSHITK